MSGNFVARRRYATIKPLLEYIGIEPERIQFSWISAGEGERFADIITKITEDVKKIGPASRLVKGEKK
ncbi:MAG: hydrogenase iron-sulfur subunit [Candidatus Cloacimonetes bacterium]|nr:hydrogenase iron-sulfur subunit [Candidatus Cloacimonadota bacterium]